MQKTYFISDIHLCNDHPESLQLFLNFLKQCDHHVDSIYILGDLFESYIGDDDTNNCLTTVIQALHNTTVRGIPIYYLHGNRDFLIGKQFLKQTGCQLLNEESIIKVYGQPVLLMHGDTLCTKDHAYLRARKILRNRFYLWFFLKLPLNVRMKIADRLRSKSKTYTRISDTAIMDVDQTTVEAKMLSYHVTVLIHGHTHQPAIHPFMVEKQTMKRIVLGAWHQHASILSCDANGQMTLLNI